MNIAWPSEIYLRFHSVLCENTFPKTPKKSKNKERKSDRIIELGDIDKKIKQL